MALFIAGSAGVNFETLAIIDLTLADVVSAGSTAITLKDGEWFEYFTGQFTFSGDEISGGTVNSWRETFQGETVFEVSGFSVPALDFVTWSETDNNVAVRTTVLAGNDSIVGSANADRMFGYTGNDTVDGGGGQDYLRGNEGNDLIRGGADFDDVHGNMGDDTVYGGLGDDWVVGGQDNDLQFGEDGWDIVYGNLGNDTLSGGDGDDWVRGGQGDDTVSGDAGNDWIAGDKGNDTISGGAGADLFHTHGDAGIDRVLDFNRAEGDRVNVLPGTQYTVAQEGADVAINMTGGGKMILVGVQLTSLTGDWIFGA
ncbi:calcium-binding protein [Phenylobacterium sp. J367]|uniref:calcium-binding protein n=1 Tax=Phenylobacterium sp. J367 TaxID=2898435 RepID=UPI002151DE03|nr:calcium-binding protein [Phenylobacterium sp. J367]MCR5880288.1 calcium-binding protein [Phenylobacterium sp. J367]